MEVKLWTFVKLCLQTRYWIQQNIAKLAVQPPFETNAGHSHNMITPYGVDIMYYKHLDMLPKKLILH